jgi:TonB family protein
VNHGTAELQAGRYQKALDSSETLIQQMLAEAGSGETERQLFGLAVANKAIALAGLGKEEDARWYWNVARSISSAVANVDLSRYGAAGERLAASAPPPPDDVPLRVGGDVRAPVVMKRLEPLYPEAARKARITGIVIIESVIDKSGGVRSAWILKGLPAPTMAYSATEGLRQWRFIPGKINGKPVSVIFNLTVNFRLKAEEEPKP